MKTKFIILFILLAVLFGQTITKKLERKRKFVFMTSLIGSIVTGSYYAIYEGLNYMKALKNQNAIIAYSEQLNTIDSIERIFLQDTLKLCSKATVSVALNSQVLFALNLQAASKSPPFDSRLLSVFQSQFLALNQRLKQVFHSEIHSQINNLTNSDTFFSELLDTNDLHKAKAIVQAQMNTDNKIKDKICFYNHYSHFDQLRNSTQHRIMESAIELEYTNSVIRLFFGSFSKTRNQVYALLNEDLNKLYKEKQISQVYRYMKGVVRLGVAVTSTLTLSIPVLETFNYGFNLADFINTEGSLIEVMKSSTSSFSNALTFVEALKSIYHIANSAFTTVVQSLSKNSRPSAVSNIIESVLLVQEVYSVYSRINSMNDASREAVLELKKLRNNVQIEKTALNLRVINLSYNALGRFRKYGGIGKLVLNREIFLDGNQMRDLCKNNIYLCKSVLNQDYSAFDTGCAKDFLVEKPGFNTNPGFRSIYAGNELSVYLNYNFSTSTNFVLDYAVGMEEKEAKNRFNHKISGLNPKIEYNATKLLGTTKEIIIFWNKGTIDYNLLREICNSYGHPHLVRSTRAPSNPIKHEQNYAITLKKLENDLTETLSTFAKRPIMAFTPEELDLMRFESEQITKKILDQSNQHPPQAQYQRQPQAQYQHQPQAQYQRQAQYQHQPQAQYQRQAQYQHQPKAQYQAQYQHQPQAQRQPKAQYQAQYQPQPQAQYQHQRYSQHKFGAQMRFKEKRIGSKQEPIDTNILTDLVEVDKRLYTGIDMLLIGEKLSVVNISVPFNAASTMHDLLHTAMNFGDSESIPGQFKANFNLVKINKIHSNQLFIPHNSGEGQCLYRLNSIKRESSQKVNYWNKITWFDKMSNSGNLESLRNLALLTEHYDVLKFNSKEHENVHYMDKLHYLTKTPNEFNIGGALHSREFTYRMDELIGNSNKYCGYFLDFKEIRVEGPLKEYGMKIIRNNELGFPVLKLSKPKYGELAFKNKIFVGMFYESNSLSIKLKEEKRKLIDGIFRKLSHFNYYALPNEHLEVKVKNEGIDSTVEKVKSLVSDQDGKVTLYVFTKPAAKH